MVFPLLFRQDKHTVTMRLVAVSIVKNEADIIECFVRHTLAWVDHHLIFDHDSTDGTREILHCLQHEGLPITLFRDDAPGHLQQARSNHLTRLAAKTHGADWVLPLDADEILTGPDRPSLEQSLGSLDAARPASLPLLDYCPTTGDEAAIINPVIRMRHCQPRSSRTRKIFIPRRLAADPGFTAGKGNHALYRGTEILPDHPLPADYHLAHLALRSPQHQVLRVVRAELQRQSRGRAAAGLDVHYRLGYQLLAENPGLFFATVCGPAAGLRLQPIPYRGGPLRYTTGQDWFRVTRALLPYLDQLAASHGRLADITGFDTAAHAGIEATIHEIPRPKSPLPLSVAPVAAFDGFTALEGWGEAEGPVPEAFLPPFHWGYAPVTRLAVDATTTQPARLEAEMLTYSEGQVLTVELDGVPVARHAFTRTNQKEHLSVPLALRHGRNQLILRFEHGLVTDHDPRRLAVIFLSLRVT